MRYGTSSDVDPLALERCLSENVRLCADIVELKTMLIDEVKAHRETAAAMHDFEAEENAAEERIKALEDGLRGLVHKIEVIEDSYEFLSVFAIASVHGQQYRGETWTPELTAARALLEQAK